MQRVDECAYSLSYRFLHAVQSPERAVLVHKPRRVMDCYFCMGIEICLTDWLSEMMHQDLHFILVWSLNQIPGRPIYLSMKLKWKEPLIQVWWTQNQISMLWVHLPGGNAKWTKWCRIFYTIKTIVKTLRHGVNLAIQQLPSLQWEESPSATFWSRPKLSFWVSVMQGVSNLTQVWDRQPLPCLAFIGWVTSLVLCWNARACQGGK